MTTIIMISPGWTHTGMTGANKGEKPPGAWSPQETVLYMVRSPPCIPYILSSFRYADFNVTTISSTNSAKANSTSSSRTTRPAKSSTNCASCGPQATLPKGDLLSVVGTRITRPCSRSTSVTGWLSSTKVTVCSSTEGTGIGS